jgi:hypothetical protein
MVAQDSRKGSGNERTHSRIYTVRNPGLLCRILFWYIVESYPCRLQPTKLTPVSFSPKMTVKWVQRRRCIMTLNLIKISLKARILFIVQLEIIGLIRQIYYDSKCSFGLRIASHLIGRRHKNLPLFRFRRPSFKNLILSRVSVTIDGV